MYFPEAETTGATNWYECLNGWFDKLLKTESELHESEKVLGASHLREAHTFVALILENLWNLHSEDLREIASGFAKVGKE